MEEIGGAAQRGVPAPRRSVRSAEANEALRTCSGSARRQGAGRRSHVNDNARSESAERASNRFLQLDRYFFAGFLK